jgi:ferredoxin
MIIFYFTGTGNSLWAARKIADATGATLISIASVREEHHEYKDDVIGFIYPQYAVGLPKMMRRFITQNTFFADYMLAIDLYAFIRMGALREIAGLLPINYGAYLKTPNNFIFAINSPKNPEKVLKKAQARLTRLIVDISAHKSKQIRPRARIGNATKYFGKNSFRVTDACIQCGTCVKVCPADNVELKDKPIFGSNCETCFACANHCPAHAIYSNDAMLKRRQYRNPEVPLDEIIKANNRAEGTQE